jgi:uncharacterized protein (TIGR00255 family)
MTGFAQSRRATPAGEVSISLRGVNHRGLDLVFYLQPELLVFENDMRAALKRSIGRGHVELRGSILRSAEAQSTEYSRAAIARYVAAFRHAAHEHGLNQHPDLNVAFSQSGVWEQSGLTANESQAPQVLEIVEECIVAFNAQREREGRGLVTELDREAAEVGKSSRDIAALRTDALPFLQERLRDRLSELLAQSTLSEARLAEETAILVDRSDIQEELARLDIHTSELQNVLTGGGEMGKRLDFLLQEMNRETNTILSKTSGAGDAALTITRRALAIKASIEKMREQSLNIE